MESDDKVINTRIFERMPRRGMEQGAGVVQIVWTVVEKKEKRTRPGGAQGGGTEALLAGDQAEIGLRRRRWS